MGEVYLKSKSWKVNDKTKGTKVTKNKLFYGYLKNEKPQWFSFNISVDCRKWLECCFIVLINEKISNEHKQNILTWIEFETECWAK